ncbi:MAG: VanZ family protein [Intrasporangiaceae bacterium]|nr:VanZ family protein [Intrasporangiaceae bacterium]
MSRGWRRRGHGRRCSAQIGGNLLVLPPLAFLVPLHWPQQASLRTVETVRGTVTLVIEVTQFAMRALLGVSYKAFDVDDLMLNLLGVVAGWALYRLLDVRMPDRNGWSAARHWGRAAPS